jgi:choline dehydrogenase
VPTLLQVDRPEILLGVRVFSVDKLRAMDASVFPVLVPGYLQATIYGLAEKIAADIKSAW